MSCGVGRRHGWDPALLWLWWRPVATAPIGPLAWEPLHAAGAALKRQKQTNKYLKNRTHNWVQGAGGGEWVLQTCRLGKNLAVPGARRGGAARLRAEAQGGSRGLEVTGWAGVSRGLVEETRREVLDTGEGGGGPRQERESSPEHKEEGNGVRGLGESRDNGQGCDQALRLPWGWTPALSWSLVAQLGVSPQRPPGWAQRMWWSRVCTQRMVRGGEGGHCPRERGRERQDLAPFLHRVPSASDTASLVAGPQSSH